LNRFTFTFLKWRKLGLGYVLIFGSALMKDGIKRTVDGLPEENFGVSASLREPKQNGQPDGGGNVASRRATP
jgi:hypothetical protein